MGNSCVTGASRSNPEQNLKSSVTPLSSPAERTTFKWIIDGLSSLLDEGEGWTYSRVFEIMGQDWYLKLNPMHKNSGDEEYVSLRLELSEHSVKPDIVVEASFVFWIYDLSYGKHIKNQVSHSFQNASTTSMIACMIPLKTLKKQSSGFFVNNSCVFGVEFIKVVTVKVNTTVETLFIQKKNTFKEAKTYTWDIEDYSALKNPDYSPEFEVGGCKWVICMRPSNDGNYLSLYLDMKKPKNLPNDFANLIELAFSIKNQESGKHLKKTGCRLEPSSISPGWGFTKFIPLEDFKDASNGYLINNKCRIEAEVAIVGSSKTE